MFTNLIESSSHRREFKRRSSFFLATVASYALIILAAGVVGVLTYDAHVEAQTADLELLEWVPQVDRTVPPERPREPNATPRPKQANVPVDPNLNEAVRTGKAESTTDDPSRVPPNTGVEPSNVPAVRGPYRVGHLNVNPVSVGLNLTGCITCSGSGTPKVVEVEKAPLPPEPPKPKTIRAPSSLIMSNVIEMPKPAYPEIAKRTGIQGSVNVQILIDESGKVISAQAVNGSAMLTKAAVEAARRARFTPTKLGDQPVKVQGVITYNFVLQR
jgi:protein TonB